MTWRKSRAFSHRGKAIRTIDQRRDEMRGAAQALGPGGRPVATALRDTHVTHEQSPVGIGIAAQMPSTMPRAEDDDTTRAGSRDFHDQPGSGGNTVRRRLFF
jgi:hypothetical protein